MRVEAESQQPEVVEETKPEPKPAKKESKPTKKASKEEQKENEDVFDFEEDDDDLF